MSEDIRDISPVEPPLENQYKVKPLDPDARGGQDNFRDDFEQAEEEETHKEKDKKTAHARDEAELLETDRVIISSAALPLVKKDAAPDPSKKASSETPAEKELEKKRRDDTISPESGHIDIKA